MFYFLKRNVIYTVIGLVAFGLAFITSNAKAQDNNFSFDYYGLRDGLSQSFVNCIVQDKQGFIWFGTQDGLNKFDGYHFKSYKTNPKDSNTVSNNYINDLAVDEDGNLWIATENGLNKFNPETERFTHFIHSHSGSELKQRFTLVYVYQNVLYTASGGTGLFQIKLNDKAPKLIELEFNSLFTQSIIQCLYADKSGVLWIGTNNKGLLKYTISEKKLQHLFKEQKDNFYNNSIFSIQEINDSILWLGTDNGLNIFHRNSGKLSNIKYDPGKRNGITNNFIKEIFKDKSGAFWLATYGGLLKYNTKTGNFAKFQFSPDNRKGISGNKVNCIYEDMTGTMWVGTEAGINKFDRLQNKFKLLTPRTNFGLKSHTNNVWSIYDDVANNTLYIGTDAGLTVLNRENGTNFTIKIPNKEPQVSLSVTCIQKLTSQILLIGTEKGLFEYNIREHHIIPYKIKETWHNQLREKFILSLKIASDSTLWIGTKEGLFSIVLSDGSADFYTNNNAINSLSNNDVRAIQEDMDGNMWLGTFGGGINKIDFYKETKGITNKAYFVKFLSDLNSDISLSSNNILSIAQTKKGYLWVGTYGSGLNELNTLNGKVNRLNTFKGLSESTIYSILPESSDVLWCSTNNGLIKIKLSDSTVTSYYENDGLQSNEFNSGASFKSSEGEMFFGGVDGMNAFFSNQIINDTIAPNVVITALKIFNKPINVLQSKLLRKSISFTKEIVLSYKQNFFSFEFAALHFSAPENNEFKYMMEGIDEEWNYVGTQNQAYYTNLEPGEYTFKVLGSNSDGVWSKQPAMIKIIITPPFWKTWWFRGLFLLALVSVIFYYYKQREYRIVKQRNFLENQIKERTTTVLKQKGEIESQKAIIEEQKKRTESLVLSILPKETAEELMNKGFSKPRNYSLCTVVFTDFEGFTKIAEKLRPQQLVDELNKYFTKFDEISGKYNMERIKTIGDSYMCAGGIPIRNKSNPIEAVLTALEIQHFMKNASIDIDGKTYTWKLRIGINTGEIIAGVIGKTKFAFDIWGDTVNTASRTESSGEAGRVNITKATYDHVKDFFDCTYRGKIAAKNKGEIEMYFVDRIKPKLSKDNEGIVPNEIFDELFNKLLLDKFSYKKSEMRVLKLLSERLPENLYYHGIHHTIDVTNAAEEIARLEGVEGEDLFLLKTAALFHDSGFTKEYTKNECIGVAYAHEILPKYGYSEHQIGVISKIIMATEMPQRPKTHLEMIMCDADLDYLGREDFYEISDSLKKELMAFGKIKTNKEWDEIQVPFLENHQYFTETNKRRRQPFKEKRIEELKNKLADSANYQ